MEHQLRAFCCVLRRDPFGLAFGAYVWDGRGRLASAGPVNYAYGPDEQLTGVDDAKYAVDPNQRLSKTLVRTLGDGTTTYYVYGLGLIYDDTNGAMSTYHFDHVGSTVAITADDGNTVTDRMTYSSYGTATSRSGSTSTPFLFNGSLGVMTDSAGLLYMRTRYYNPRIMRFISADTIGFGGGSNWYAFCNGDPVNFFDPNGMDRVVGWYAGNPIIVKDNPAPGANPFASSDHYIDPITQTVNDTRVSVGFSGTVTGVSVFDARLTFGLTQLPTFSNKTFDNFGVDLGTGLSLDFHIGFKESEPTNAIGAELGEHLGGELGLDENGNLVEYTVKLGVGVSALPLNYEIPLQNQKKCPSQ